MTQKDIDLLQRALDTPCTDWHLIHGLTLQAETDEARALLENIEGSKYHSDEYFAGIQ